jgi:hypothetical protein
MPDFLRMLSENNSSESQRLGLIMGSVVFSLVYILVSIVVETIWRGFISYVGLKNAQSEGTTVGVGFRTALRAFWKILGTSILIGLIAFLFFLPAILVGITGAVFAAGDQEGLATGVIIAACLLAVGGAVFAVRFNVSLALTYYAMFDENLGIQASMARSRSLTKGRLMEMLGMTFAAAIVPVISPVLIAFGIGAYYLQLKVYRDHNVELPKTHILSWLPLMFIAFIAFIVFLIAVFAGMILTR